MREGSCYHAIAYRRSWNYGMTLVDVALYRTKKSVRQQAAREKKTQREIVGRGPQQ